MIVLLFDELTGRLQEYKKHSDLEMKEEIFNRSKKYNDVRYVLIHKTMMDIPSIVKSLLKQDIIPFFHPEIEPSKLINSPEFLKIRDIEDFFLKIQYLNEDEWERNWILAKAKECFIPKWTESKSNLFKTLLKPFKKLTS